MGEGSLTFPFFIMFLSVVFLGSGPGQVRSRQLRSSLTVAKARWYPSSMGRGGEAIARTGRTLGTAGASDKVISISPKKKKKKKKKLAGRILGVVGHAYRNVAQGLALNWPRSPQKGDHRFLPQKSQGSLLRAQSGCSLHLRYATLTLFLSQRPVSARLGFERPASRDPRYPRRSGCERLWESPRFSCQRREIFESV